MTMRAHIVDHLNIHPSFIKVTQSVGLFVKKAGILVEKVATAAVAMVITGGIIFALYLGLIQFAFLILS